jgi:hypothetical protein
MFVVKKRYVLKHIIMLSLHRRIAPLFVSRGPFRRRKEMAKMSRYDDEATLSDCAQKRPVPGHLSICPLSFADLNSMNGFE